MSGPTPVVHFDEIDSTNAEARRRAEQGDTGPVWFTAAHQTQARGRRGRRWETSEGNLAATYLFVTRKAPAEAAQISFVAALAAADLADAFISPAFVTLKWPNDTLIDGRKSAGILVESGPAPMGGLWVAVGIGFNLARAPAILPPPALQATSLAEYGPPPTPNEAMDVLGLVFERRVLQWEREGFAAISTAWTGRAHGLGKTCVARLPHETIEGVAEGLDIDGALRLRTADGVVRRITAGDVFF